jgi:uncharacterized membrane protein (DUF106 family)
MWTVNRILGSLIEGVLYPFRDLPQLVGLAVISLLVSIPLMLGFKALSDQDALAAAKRRIHAGVFEIRLFNDNLRAITRAQLDILRHTLTYFRLSFVPMAWMMIPLVLILIQLQFHYGYGALETGQPAIVKVSLAQDSGGSAAARPQLALTVSDGLRVETPMLWIPSQREASWRIGAGEPGHYQVTVTTDEAEFAKSVVFTGAPASSSAGRRSPRRPSSAFFDQLFYPVERPLSGGAAVASITVRYPDGRVSLLGWKTHWLVAFFVLTLLFALLLQKPLRVRL